MANEAGEVRDEPLDAEGEARRRVALAQIRQFPDPVLRLKAPDVEAFDEKLKVLVGRMIALMRDASGAGLAATQVGILRRLFVIQAGDEEEPRTVVNPRVVERSDELAVDEEGCLSLHGVRVPVERHTRLVLDAQDENGADVRLELEGFGARVAQHELDHLDGILMIDRTTAEARREAMAILRPKPVLVL